MAFLPSSSGRVVFVRETGFVPAGAGPSRAVSVVGRPKSAKKAWSMGDRNYMVLPPRVRPVPVSDLTIFGGSGGTRRFYKAEKETIPEFSGKLEDQWHSEGDNIVLRIGYKGHPEPLAQWFKGQEPLVPDPDSRKVVITEDGTYAQLALFNVQRPDGGYYSCRIENANGVLEMGCHVFIKEAAQISGAKGCLKTYRSVLYTPSQHYSRY